MGGGAASTPAASEEDGSEWDVERVWQDELESLGVRGPSDMKGVSEVVKVQELVHAVLPFRLSNEGFVRLQTEEEMERWRAEAEQELIKVLDRLSDR